MDKQNGNNNNFQKDDRVKAHWLIDGTWRDAIVLGPNMTEGGYNIRSLDPQFQVIRSYSAYELRPMSASAGGGAALDAAAPDAAFVHCSRPPGYSGLGYGYDDHTPAAAAAQHPVVAPAAADVAANAAAADVSANAAAAAAAEMDNFIQKSISIPNTRAKVYCTGGGAAPAKFSKMTIASLLTAFLLANLLTGMSASLWNPNTLANKPLPTDLFDFLDDQNKSLLKTVLILFGVNFMGGSITFPSDYESLIPSIVEEFLRRMSTQLGETMSAASTASKIENLLSVIWDVSNVMPKHFLNAVLAFHEFACHDLDVSGCDKMFVFGTLLEHQAKKMIGIFKSLGYICHLPVRPPGHGESVFGIDGLIAAQIMYLATSSLPGVIVVISGDGNTNHSLTSIFDAVEFALKEKRRKVRIVARNVNERYKELQIRFEGLLEILVITDENVQVEPLPGSHASAGGGGGDAAQHVIQPQRSDHFPRGGVPVRRGGGKHIHPRSHASAGGGGGAPPQNVIQPRRDDGRVRRGGGIHSPPRPPSARGGGEEAAARPPGTKHDSSDFAKKDRVVALLLEDGKWYPATVVGGVDGWCKIRFDHLPDQLFDRSKQDLRFPE